jgi:ABC-type uncharacterized transport system permease subunit
MSTLFLTQSGWDLAVDVSGNIAVAAEPYAVTQDVATAVRTFLGECWYDTTKGIPYWQQVLGLNPPLSLLKSLIETTALTLQEVTTAVAFITGVANRGVSGQIQITDTNGITSNLGII